MTAEEALTRDLRKYLIDEFYSVPAPRRRRSAWVMNIEWLNECRKIDKISPGHYIGRIGQPETMLGLPLYVTEDGGFPHLIAD